MLSDQIPCVELVALKALADLDQLEGSWQSIMESSDPEGVALLLRLLLAHMASTSKRLLGAMVLDRLDADLLSRDVTGPESCHAFVTPPLSNKKADP